jgi:lysozyme
MFTRRHVLAAALGLLATPAWAARRSSGNPHGLDAVIDISHSTRVNDFRLARRHSRILGVIHKATEGGDWVDPLYARRRVEAEAAGMLWGAYHFGTREFSGTAQAELFLRIARPGPSTLLALDLEYNDQNPSNTMGIRHAEDFVRAVFAATGRRPLIYTTAAWADNQPVGPRQRRLGGRITEDSILAKCPLWIADYRARPELPSAWRAKGWHFWQYAGDTGDGGLRQAMARQVAGIASCDRNYFRGDEATLRKFWTARELPGKTRKA